MSEMFLASDFVSVVLPCLNEEKTVGLCVKRALTALRKEKLKGEVIVSDNGSSDDSIKLAKKAGARIIKETRRGYGSAYLAGIKAANGKFIVIGDSDGTYDFSEIYKLLRYLNKGFDMVIGSRLKGNPKKGSMPFLNRYFGTPILNFFLRFFYHVKVSDSQSGMRAFSKKAFNRLKLKTLGMEFASEMLVRAGQEKLKIAEVPISYFQRIAPTKLSRFRDAWRHIRFMLLFAPTYLFLIPGGLLMVLGVVGVFGLQKGTIVFLNHGFGVHAMILSSMLVTLGYQLVMLGIYAKVFGWLQGLGAAGWTVSTFLRFFTLEKSIILGLVLFFAGIVLSLFFIIPWIERGFGQLEAEGPLILSLTLVVLGIQVIFSSFFLSIMGTERRG